MRIIDISWSLCKETVGYKNKKKIEFEREKKFDQDAIRVTRIRMGAHDGTHIDAPSHFIKEGKTVNQVPLESCIGECIVIDLTHVGDKITSEHLAKFPIQEGDIVLLKTTNSALSSLGDFNKGFVYLGDTGAHYLVEKKVKAVGIDYLGIERDQKDHPTHIELFRNNITIIEGLRLKNAPQGAYFFCCLPLDIVGLEAAPARAILIPGEEK